jgi:hypothetical protein
MANPKKTKASLPRPVRVPPKRAAGLDDELTAQPRPLSDELGESDGGQAGLSVDPEDLAVRFLSEATEQGDTLPHTLMESELGPTTGLDSDAVLTPPNFEHENTLWEQTVDLMTQTRNAADQLRGPPVVTDDDDALEREIARDTERALSREDATGRVSEVRVPESDIRELSLFDRAADEEADAIEAPIEREDSARRARTTPANERGVQLEGPPEPSAAASGNRWRQWTLHATRAVLLGLAATLNRWANRLREAGFRTS